MENVKRYHDCRSRLVRRLGHLDQVILVYLRPLSDGELRDPQPFVRELFTASAGSVALFYRFECDRTLGSSEI